MSTTREYMCKKCKVCHERPTGKKCPRQADPDEASGMEAVLTMLSKIDSRLSALEEAKVSDVTSDTGEEASPRSLQRDQRLKKKVHQRMADLHILEESSDDDTGRTTACRPTQGKKSGRAKTLNDVVVRDIDWPHYHVYRGPHRAPATYEDLTIQEFVYGFMCQLIDAKTDSKIRENQLQYLRDIMREATDHPWPNVRNLHGIVLSHMEMDRVAWTDDDAIRNLRETYITRAPTSQTPQVDNRRTNKRYCLMFQDGRCKQLTPEHSSPRGSVNHFCAFCYRVTGNSYQHAEMDCNRKSKSTKNEDRPSGTIA